jgi:endoglucanase
MIKLAITLILCAVAAAIVPAGASALTLDPDGFRLQSSSMTVAQSAGSAVVTIERNDTSSEAQIRYETLPGSAVRGQDYQPVKGMLDFAQGQSSASFSIPIVDHQTPEPPKTLGIALFSPYLLGMGSPSAAVLTITGGTLPPVLRNPVNPLDLSATPPTTNPLSGAQPFVDWKYGLSAIQQRRWRHSHPRAAGMLGVIASQPGVQRFGNWSGRDPGLQVAQFLDRAAVEQPGTVPELATYYLVEAKRIHPQCRHYSDAGWRQAAFHRWMQSLAQGIGNYRAIMFLEMDSLITVGCLSRHGVEVRMAELRDAINILSHLPRVVVYLDAGAADAVPARETARLLRRAGVSEIQGFFLNSTHFDWTSREIRYGEEISRMTGGKHFVVNTSENGHGPLVPRNRVKYGNELHCNPRGRGLGPKPTFDTGYPNVDAFAWIATPGKSGGTCGSGDPPGGDYWPAMALGLVRRADFAVR